MSSGTPIYRFVCIQHCVKMTHALWVRTRILRKRGPKVENYYWAVIAKHVFFGYWCTDPCWVIDVIWGCSLLPLYLVEFFQSRLSASINKSRAHLCGFTLGRIQLKWLSHKTSSLRHDIVRPGLTWIIAEWWIHCTFTRCSLGSFVVDCARCDRREGERWCFFCGDFFFW